MSKNFRKRVSMALTVSMIAANISLPVVAQVEGEQGVIIEDRFEQEVLGTAPSQYLDASNQSVTTGSAIIITREGEQALKLNGEGQKVEVKREFVSTTENYVTISLDFRVDENSDRSKFIQLLDQNGNEALRFMIRNYGKELQYQAASFNSDTKDPAGKLGNIVPGEWVNLKIVADMTTQTAKAYYNGAYVENLPFWNKLINDTYKVTGLTVLKTTTDSSVGHYIDNVTVSQTNELEVEEPSEESVTLVVDQTGADGAYTTIQAAVDAVQANSSKKTIIKVNAGTYNEVVTFGPEKSNVEVIGAGADQTIITYDNYSGKVNPAGGEYTTFNCQTLEVNASDVTFKDLTIENSFEASKAPDQKTHQAVALKVKGERVAFENCKILGRQDTLLTDGGSQYFYNCYIAGDVDFIFGKSQAVFEECEIFSLDRGDSKNNGYIIAPCTSSEEAYGYLFLRCKLTAPSTIAKDSVYLGRPWCPDGLEKNKPAALFKDCEMGEHIKADAWSPMGSATADHGRFYEYNTTVNGEKIPATEVRRQLVPEIAERFTVANILKGWDISKTTEEVKEPLVAGDTELESSQVSTAIPDGTVIFEDDFNNYVVGEFPEGYEKSQLVDDKVVTGNPIYIVAKEEGSSDKAAFVGQEEGMVVGESKGQIQLVKKFDVQKHTFTVSVDFSIDEVTSDTYLALVDTAGKEAVRVEMRGKALAYRYRDEANTIIDTSVSSNLIAKEWVNVKIVANIDEQYAVVYVDGVPSKKLPFYNYNYQVAGIDSFKTVTPKSKVVSHRVDNLSIVTGDATKNNSNNFLPSDFSPSEVQQILTKNQHIALHEAGVIAINEAAVVNKPSAVNEVTISKVDVIDNDIVLVTLNSQFNSFNFNDIILKKAGTSAEDLTIKASVAGQTLNRNGETVLIYKINNPLEGTQLEGVNVEAEVINNGSKDINGKSLVVGNTKTLNQKIESKVTSLTLTVDQNGQGDFTKVQDAINAVADQGEIPTTINIKAGIYDEIVTVPKSKANITFLGEGHEVTKITGNNYSGKPKDENSTYGTSDSATVFIYGNNLTFRGIGFENSFDKSTAHDGKTHQAVAVNVEGDKVSFDRCGFFGKQDTLLTNGNRQYFYRCYIEGDVDFIFSDSQAVFEECTLHSVGSGYIAAPSTAIEKGHGYLFLRCKLTADESVPANSVALGRPWRQNASVLYKECEMGSHIKTHGWDNMSDNTAALARFYEYKNTGAGAVTNETRTQLSDAEAEKWTISNVLEGWEPTHSDEDIVPPVKTIAFPGAEGGGRFATGGRGQEVYIVTTLEDYIPGVEAAIQGSLRDALSKDNRTIVFNVSGNVHLKARLDFSKRKNVTIAGQTAPGDGITVTGYETVMNWTDNIIMRYMRFRPGSDNIVKGGDSMDALWGRDVSNVMIDHISTSWSTDETLTIYRAQDTTVQWSITNESLAMSGHTKGRHGYGMITGGENVTYHHNLIANHTSRAPRFGGGTPGYSDIDHIGHFDVRNNVIYNWGFNGTYGGGFSESNFINNYLKPGLGTSDNVRDQIINAGEKNKYGAFYVAGNVLEGRPDISADNQLGITISPENASATTILSQPIKIEGNSSAALGLQTAEAAYEDVLDKVGATYPRRDALDARVVQEVKDGTGRFANKNHEVGGLPVTTSEKRPDDFDKDYDGMADTWELLNKLDPTNPNDHKELALDGSGYTNLEKYINSLVDMDYASENADVTLKSPVMNQSYKLGETVRIEADIKSVNTIERVDFYNGDQIIGTKYEAPYVLETSELADGTYFISAKVTDTEGNQTQSTASIISVNEPFNSSVWRHTDIGNVPIIGSASVNAGEVTIKGSGRLEGAADTASFIYQKLKGNGEIIAKLDTVETWDNHIFSGLMVRESLNADAATVALGLSATKGFEYKEKNPSTGKTDTLYRNPWGIYLASRNATGGLFPKLGENLDTVVAAESVGVNLQRDVAFRDVTNTIDQGYYLKIVREGDVFTAYSSPDAKEWTTVGTRTIPMGEEVYVGLASDANKIANGISNLNTARFSDVAVNGDVVAPPVTAPAPTKLIKGLETKKVYVNDTVSLEVSATGEGKVTFEWFKDNTLVDTQIKEASESAVTSTYSISKASKKDAGEYRVRITADGGSVETKAQLVVEERADNNNSDSGSSGGGSTSSKDESVISKLESLTTKQVEKIKESLDKYLPYTISNTKAALEMLKQLTGDVFTEAQLKEMLAKPETLSKLNITLDWEVFPGSTGSRMEFKDVKKKHWAYENIQGLVELGVINGFEDSTFRPSTALKAADTFTALNHVLLLNDINHVSLSRDIVEKYITQKEHWAFADMASIASKLSEDTLKTIAQVEDKPLTRELVAQVLYEVTKGELEQIREAKGFTDIANSPYKEAINYCVGSGLLSGVSATKMSPEKTITRAELATVMMKLSKLLSESDK